MNEEDVEALEDKLREELKQEIKEAREQKALFEGLLLHPGWGILARILRAQIERRKDEVVAEALGGQRTIYKQEYWKGEISGLRLALAFPEIMVEELSRLVGEEPDDAADPVSAGSSEYTGGERDFDPGRDLPDDPSE